MYAVLMALLLLPVGCVNFGPAVDEAQDGFTPICCDGDYTFDQCEVDGLPSHHVDCFDDAVPPDGCEKSPSSNSLLYCCPAPMGDACATA